MTSTLKAKNLKTALSTSYNYGWVERSSMIGKNVFPGEAIQAKKRLCRGSVKCGNTECQHAKSTRKVSTVPQAILISTGSVLHVELRVRVSSARPCCSKYIRGEGKSLVTCVQVGEHACDGLPRPINKGAPPTPVGHLAPGISAHLAQQGVLQQALFGSEAVDWDQVGGRIGDLSSSTTNTHSGRRSELKAEFPLGQGVAGVVHLESLAYERGVEFADTERTVCT